MIIGQLVKSNIHAIINYCNNIKHDEFELLCNEKYSKSQFELNFPFFMDVEHFDETNRKKQSKRYWSEVYLVRGRRVRITSQWFKTSIPLFISYLDKNNINLNIEGEIPQIDRKIVSAKQRVSSHVNSRYRGNAIGNAQNLLIRNILSNLGNESFSEENWNETKKYFDYKCAYCGEESELLIEHAIPINKEKLGEHRLGNIVPSCKKCNSLKADRTYREFLGGKMEEICKIENYMESRNYVPLDDNEQMKKILNIAYEEVSYIANRYITIINELFVSE